MSVVLRAALYPRVSTEEQKKFGLSIHDQQNDLEKIRQSPQYEGGRRFPGCRVFRQKED